MRTGNDTDDRKARANESTVGLTRRRALQAAGAGLLAPSLVGATASAALPERFVGASGGDFVLDGSTFYPLGGNHPQLRKQSKEKQVGLLEQWTAQTDGTFNTLRASAFGSGTERTTLPLQPEPGEYNEAGFEALDRLIAACGERGIRLVLPLTNYYPWQGGMDQYVAWADGASTRNNFYTNDQIQQWYRDYIKYVLNRTNTVTDTQYKNDPTIMLWELANEPEGGEAFLNWVEETANYIKSIDSNHLVSTGAAMTINRQLFRQAHQPDAIDACSLHIWADERHTGIGPGGGVRAIRESKQVADDLGKPMYVGEFGWQVGRGDQNEIEDAIEINERNRVFEAWLSTMRDVGMDGSLVWDFRRRGEYPLTWNWYAVFPQDYRTSAVIEKAYAAFAEPPGGSSVPTDPPALSVETGSGGGDTQLTVPDNGGDFGPVDPSFTLAPSGEEFADPDGTDNTSGPGDLSADVYLGYDTENLYLRVAVTDDQHFGQATDVYQGDSIQWAAAADGSYGPEYGLSLDNGSPVIERYSGGNAAEGPGAVDAQVSRDGTTTTYDVRLPWTTLFAEAKEPGDVVPFSMIVNDNDGDDTTRDGVVGWTLPAINTEKTASALGRLVLASDGGAPWQASSEGGPAILNAATRGTWTATVSNYAEGAQTFDIAVEGTDAAKTVKVPAGGTADVTVERAFGTRGLASLALSVTNTATGETRTLTEPVVVLEEGTPNAAVADLSEPSGTRLLADPYADTSKLASSSDAGNLVVNDYNPQNHPLPDGTTDDTRLKRRSAETTTLVYETGQPVSTMVLVWSQNSASPGSITFEESTDGGASWNEVSATTEQYITAGPDDTPGKWQQKRSLVSGFSEGATAVRYTIEGGAPYSVQPQRATFYTPGGADEQPAPTGPELLRDPYADTTKLAPASDAGNFVVNSYKPARHPLPDGSPDDTRLKRGTLEPTGVVYATEQPIGSMELLWSQEKFHTGAITFYESTDGGASWSEVSATTEQYATAGTEDYPAKWRQKRTTVTGFSKGATMVRYVIEGGATYSPQPQRAVVYGRPRPPMAKIKPSTTEATVGERLTFRVEDATEKDRWIDSLSWGFGDGTPATGWWAAHRYDAAGTYTVALTATDNTGHSTTHEVTIMVANLTEPIARIQPSTTEAAVGERLTFRVEDATGEDRWIDSLSWEFGDGTTAAGWWVAHRYDAAGTYTVALTAIDNTGHSTTHEVTITVS